MWTSPCAGASEEGAPTLERAELLQSQAGWHEYVFDAEQVKLPALLAEASAQASGKLCRIGGYSGQAL